MSSIRFAGPGRAKSLLRISLVLAPCIIMVLLAIPSDRVHRQAAAATGSIDICSVTSSGGQGDGDSLAPAVTADGRYVAFESDATNLVTGDTNAKKDIFRKDLATGEVLLCSCDASAALSDNNSYNSSISDDGRYVAFESDATNLVTGDTNAKKDIFRKDLATGEVLLCSCDASAALADRASFNASICSDGRYVAFESDATNLVTGDTNVARDVFRKDLTSGEVLACSCNASGILGGSGSGSPSINDSGRYVAFDSNAINLNAGDTDYYRDVFRKDLTTGEVTLCSTDSSGEKGKSDGRNCSLSANGDMVAFESYGEIWPGYSNSGYYVFHKDISSGVLTPCSETASGSRRDCRNKSYPSISRDGKYVSFHAQTNLVSTYTGSSFTNVYRKEIATGEIALCSASDSNEPGDSWSSGSALNSDGSLVFFASLAGNLLDGDNNGKRDVFCKQPLSEPRFPRIDSLSIDQAGIGVEINVYGFDFGRAQGDSYVTFGSVTATNYTSWGDFSCKVIVPEGISGEVQVTLTNTLGTTNSVSFTAATPHIDHISAYPGFSIGNEATISGYGFSPTRGGSYVSIGPIVVDEYVFWSEKSIRFKIPEVAQKQSDLTVTTTLGTSDPVTLTITAPSIRSSSGDFVTGGVVWLNGDAFGRWRGGSYVSIGSYKINEYEEWSDERIKFVIPDSLCGRQPWTVTTAGGTSEAMNYGVHPTIDSVEPEYCLRGSVLTIKGSGFGPSRGSGYVYFGDEVWGHEEVVRVDEYLLWSIDEIKVRVPYEVPGTGDIEVGVNTGENCRKQYGTKIYPYTSCFAEGYTGPGFQEYLCLGNANDHPAEVTIYYLLPDNYYWDQEITVPANSRTTINVNAEVPGMEVSAYIESDIEVAVERPIYFDYGGGWTGGHDAVASRYISANWFFAEGYTGPGFDEWICVLNLYDTDANLTFHFQTQEEGEIIRNAVVPAGSRGSFKVNDLLGPGYQCSLWLESDQYVVAERSMYFDYMGMSDGHWEGGHCVMGVPYLSNEYYFAEGTTRTGFEEWLTIQNPHDYDISVSAVYQMQAGQGSPVTRQYSIPPGNRYTVFVPGEVGMEKDVSIKLTSDETFLAERPMYFQYMGAWQGGHCVIGAMETSDDWFFAEGYTGEGFHEWLCLQNPGTKESTVEVTYLTQEAGPLTPRVVKIGAGSRTTICVNFDAGQGFQLSTRLRVTSGPGIVAERPMYFDFGGWDGGHDVVGYVPMTFTSSAYQSADATGPIPIPGFDESAWKKK